MDGMTTGHADTREPSLRTIQLWLIQRVSELLESESARIDASDSLLDCGLDSLAALALAADLEDWLGIELDPTVVWDYPTIHALAAYVHGALREQREERTG